MNEAEIKQLKECLDLRLNGYLIEMRPDYDDSITGFNEAWDIVREFFADILTSVEEKQYMLQAIGRAEL